MTPQTHSSLKELQELDQEIASIESVVGTFDAKLEEVGEPVHRLEKELKALQARLQEVTLEENRLELSIEERRVRSTKLQERMNAVRNVREEAAVHAELEMVRRALENDEQEALSLLEQIRRMEERIGEHEAAHQEELAEVEPRCRELLDEKEAAGARLQELQAKRDEFAAGISLEERRIYDSIMAGARDVAVAELTHDGACGNCFSVIPLQIQNEIRHATGMIRCEACGVILTPESEEGIAKAQQEAARIEEVLRSSEEARDAERAATEVQEEAEAEVEVEAEAEEEEEVEEEEYTAAESAVEDLAEAADETDGELDIETAEAVAEASEHPAEEELEGLAEVDEPEEEPREGAADA